MEPSPTQELVGPAGMRRERRTLVVVDVVESVRLMLADEADVIDRWRRFVDEVRTEVLPRHGGRLVKSLGDGLLLEFMSVPPAIAAALDLQARIRPYNTARQADAAICLRIGAHVADVVVDQLDVYGAGVNLAARLATLAAPGEIVVSVEARDQLVPGLDPAVEDLGECFFKHLPEALRSYRILGPTPAIETPAERPRDVSMLPAIAVIPFATACEHDHESGIGQALADALIAVMSTFNRWRLTSRLSTSVVSERRLEIDALGRLLKADYVLTGSVQVRDGRIRLAIDLTDVRSGALLWRDECAAATRGLFEAGHDLLPDIIRAVAGAILKRELSLARSLAMPTLPGYTLLINAIALMHRLSQAEVERSRAVLDHLIERHPRSADARAWLAKWHFIQVAQAWSANVADDARRARSQLRRALDEQPEHAVSLALQGHLHAFMEGDLVRAEADLRSAVAHNPSEPLGWLFLSNALANTGQGTQAIEAIGHATGLSPLDPMSYFFHTFAAAAYTAADRFAEAAAHASESARLNAGHLPGLVELIIAQVLAGQVDQGRDSAQRYLAIKPNASVARYLGNHPARHLQASQRNARALLEAGIPV